jgi:uncharacterized protein (TIGR02266 family)
LGKEDPVRRKKILLAQDPELQTLLQASFLCREGFELAPAATGAEAFAAIEGDDLALAILCASPAFAGENCCRRVKGDPLLRSTPVLLVADAGSQALARCRTAGADAVVGRPLHQTEVLRAVCALLQIVDRAGPRIPVRLLLRCGPAPLNLRAGCALDLSAGGLFVETGKLLPVGTLMHLELPLPGLEPPPRVEGRVAWVNHPEWVKKPKLPAGMGIQFLGLDAATQTALARLLEASPGGGSARQPA